MNSTVMPKTMDRRDLIQQISGWIDTTAIAEQIVDGLWAGQDNDYHCRVSIEDAQVVWFGLMDEMPDQIKSVIQYKF